MNELLIYSLVPVIYLILLLGIGVATGRGLKEAEDLSFGGRKIAP